MGRIARAIGYLGLACAFAGTAAAAQDGAAQTEPDARGKAIIADYKALSVARAIDDRCMVLDFANRRLLENAMIGHMMDLPGIAGTSPVEMGAEAYYANISAITEKHAKPMREVAANIPCAKADQALAEAKLFLAADIIAHQQISRDAFAEMADEQEKSLFAQLVRAVQGSLAQAPEGTLERYVGGRMRTIDAQGKDAAGHALWSLRQFETARLFGIKGHDLRWDEAQRGWVLWDMQRRAKVPSYVFDAPVRVPLFESEGEGWERKTFANREALLLPRKGGPSMEFVAFPTEAGMDLSGAEALVGVGSGQMDMALFLPVIDWTEGRAKALSRECPASAHCFRFDFKVTNAMEKRVRENRDVYSAQFALLASSARSIESIAKLKKAARLGTKRLYSPSLRDMFPNASRGE
ncbi:hypothetical protein [Erythrobacter sp.]|uniref:hypothetical protein n=1 Tax=Erythrobacter sp. TaxID=1042 RepID=UPI001425D125|nr:hypothetical protein [Erythrobacter sp.]QIQ87790.1 MAG: hypothetical protein G9473_14650 [Erythrobacter sp.]